MGLVFTAGENVSWSGHCGNQYESFSKTKSGNRTSTAHSTWPYHSWNSTQDSKSSNNRNACPAILTTTTKYLGRRQPRGTKEWLKKTGILYAMEFYVAIKKNKIMRFTGKQMQPESIVLRKTSQTL